MKNNNITTKIVNEVAIISLSKKPVNALSISLLIDLKDIFMDIEKNSNVRIIILKSDLNHFSAGADLKQRSIMSYSESENALNVFRDCFNIIENSSKITLCVINGYCLGGGAELSLCFDLRIASNDAIIGFPEVGIGIIPGAGGTQRLPRIIGLSNAKYWIYTAKKFTAEESFKYNFVSFIYSSDVIEVEVMNLAKKILRNSPVGTRCAKASINEGYGKDINTGLDIERDKYNLSVNTQDRKEALRAFAEKRKPIWRNM